MPFSNQGQSERLRLLSSLVKWIYLGRNVWSTSTYKRALLLWSDCWMWCLVGKGCWVNNSGLSKTNKPLVHNKICGLNILVYSIIRGRGDLWTFSTWYYKWIKKMFGIWNEFLLFYVPTLTAYAHAWHACKMDSCCLVWFNSVNPWNKFNKNKNICIRTSEIMDLGNTIYALKLPHIYCFSTLRVFRCFI